MHVMTCPIRNLYTMVMSLCDVYRHLPHDDRDPGLCTHIRLPEI